MLSNWSEKDIPDQSGKTAVVTGANSGIGWETACALVKKRASVVMACRNMEKAETAACRIRTLNAPGSIFVMKLDLADLESISAFAENFRKSFGRLDLLINNAGVAEVPYARTAQGFETHFGVNYLGHFVLTAKMAGILISTEKARVVTVSSIGHRVGSINFNDLNWELRYPPQLPYSQSKLANLLFAYELQRKLIKAGKDTISVAAHPGWSDTQMSQNSYLRYFNRIFAQPAAAGALPILYAATGADIHGGDYTGPGGFLEFRGYPKKVKSSSLSHNEELARRLWKVTEELAHIKFLIR